MNAIIHKSESEFQAFGNQFKQMVSESLNLLTV